MIGIRVPRQLLRFDALIQDFTGSGARGPLYGDARAVRCDHQPTSKLMTDEDGNSVQVDVLAIVRPEDGPVAPQSLVTVNGIVHRVIATNPYPNETRPTHYELSLRRFARASSTSGSGS